MQQVKKKKLPHRMLSNVLTSFPWKKRFSDLSTSLEAPQPGPKEDIHSCMLKMTLKLRYSICSYKHPKHHTKMFCFSTHQSTKSSIEDAEASLIASNINKAFDVSVVIGAQDFICCRINLVNTSRSHFQNHRLSGITPVMFIAVIPLQRELLLDIDTHTPFLHSNGSFPIQRAAWV